MLAVDDEKPMLALYRACLEAFLAEKDREGVRFLAASSHEEALEHADHLIDEGGHIAFGFFDVSLAKGENGLQTFLDLQKRDPHLLATIVTGNGWSFLPEVEKTLASIPRADWDYIIKPFSAAQLAAKAGQMLAEWKARESARRRAHILSRLVDAMTLQRPAGIRTPLQALETIREGFSFFSDDGTCELQLSEEAPGSPGPSRPERDGVPAAAILRHGGRLLVPMGRPPCAWAVVPADGDDLETHSALAILADSSASVIEEARLRAELETLNRSLESTVVERTSALTKADADLRSAQLQLMQSEKLASVGQLAAGVAHEINNPIGFVHSNLQTLGRYARRIVECVESLRQETGSQADGARGGGTEARWRDSKVDRILGDLEPLIAQSLEGTERVRKIVMDLKSFSHVDGAEATEADLNAGIESTLNIARNEIKHRARVETSLGDLPPLLCYPQMLNQVFMNLMVNAAQAIESQGVITITTRATDREILVSVADTGCGIAPEHRQRLFDPFFTTKPVGKGTGLGLSMAFDIVRRHGGRIDVESEPGRGSVFTVRLPREGLESEAARAEASARAAPPAAVEQTVRSRRIGSGGEEAVTGLLTNGSAGAGEGS